MLHRPFLAQRPLDDLLKQLYKSDETTQGCHSSTNVCARADTRPCDFRVDAFQNQTKGSAIRLEARILAPQG